MNEVQFIQLYCKAICIVMGIGVSALFLWLFIKGKAPWD
jgi:hypothetical protein